MSVQIKGLTAFQSLLKSTPTRLNRAARNATNRTLTYARKEAVNDFADQLDLKKKVTRDRLKITRPRQGETEGRITADNKPLPLSNYPIRLTRIAPTRAAVYVKDSFGGSYRLSGSSFVNPKFNRKLPFRRADGVARLPVSVPSGPSIAVQYDDYMSRFPKYGADVGNFYRVDFERQLAKAFRK